MLLKPIEHRDKSKNPFHECCKFLIVKYLKEKPNWPREIKIAQKILKKWPDMGFWDKYQPDLKFNSLAWFLTPEGEEEVDFLYNRNLGLKNE